MKRLFSLALALLLAMSLAGGASAAASAQLVRVFEYGDQLYTYVDIDGADQPITKADAEIDGRTFPASGTLETVRQAGFPVTWMLLVDNSNSMPPFREEAVAFAEGLAAACGENTRFLLATFGDAFSLLAEDVPADALSEQMAGIPMDETVTRLHSSISQALDFFDNIPRTGNELRGVIILSDAVQYDPGASVSQEELLERINRSDVMLHSVGFGADTEALESLSALTEASGGTHQVAGAELPAADAAAHLAEETGSLYVTSFALSGFTPEAGVVSVTFASGGELVCRGTAEISFPAAAGTDEPEQEPEQADPLPEAVIPPASNAASGQAEDDSPESGGASAGLSLSADLLLPAAGVIVVLAAVITVLCLRKRRPGADAAPSAASPEPEEQGIYVRMEILQGAYLGHDLEFTLRRELVTGRDPACDIPFADSSVSRRNSRIFLAGGTVYIEDLGSQNGTFVNGVRIEMARTLRSGDEIAMGDVAFRLKF